MKETYDKKVTELEQVQDNSNQTDDLTKKSPSVETIIDIVKADCQHLPQKKEYLDDVVIPGGGE